LLDDFNHTQLLVASQGEIMNYRKVFAERLTTLRKSRNLLQKDVSDYLEVTRQAYSLLENANRSPSFEILTALADYFNVSVDYLIGLSDKPERR